MKKKKKIIRYKECRNCPTEGKKETEKNITKTHRPTQKFNGNENGNGCDDSADTTFERNENSKK